MGLEAPRRHGGEVFADTAGVASTGAKASGGDTTGDAGGVRKRRVAGAAEDSLAAVDTRRGTSSDGWASGRTDWTSGTTARDAEQRGRMDRTVHRYRICCSLRRRRTSFWMRRAAHHASRGWKASWTTAMWRSQADLVDSWRTHPEVADSDEANARSEERHREEAGCLGSPTDLVRSWPGARRKVDGHWAEREEARRRQDCDLCARDRCVFLKPAFPWMP